MLLATVFSGRVASNLVVNPSPFFLMNRTLSAFAAFLAMVGSSFPGRAEEKAPLIFKKWTPDFEVPDPVAISFDHRGRAYVTQTTRRKANDLDIRANRDWIPNDVGFTSVAEKQAFYRERLAPENSEANQKRVKDLNGDGSHDWVDLTALSELIHRIEDADRDGKADRMSVFADGFNTEVTGIAAGVLHHEGSVYTTIAPDVWKLEDTTGDGKADRREVVAHGFGVHIAYAGHDMHGLTVGPDGRIYWSIGDKGIRVTSKEGIDFKFPNQGGVMRCEPDGSHFEVFARGLRNVQELAFDAHGNLFGVDNDADNSGEKERFVYIVQHMDAGWRANWQYRKPGYNPWMAEGMSIPWHTDQPAHVTPCIRNYENGPAGFTWNPGTALSPEWRNTFFLTSAPNGQQWAFQTREKGASFEMINDRQIGNGIPIVGINFGPDGALYGVDWGGGYPLNQKGAVWKMDVESLTDLNATERKETADLLMADLEMASEAKLSLLLANLDQRVRLKAQFELARREARSAFEEVAMNSDYPRLGRLHAIWGLGQLVRYRPDADYSALLALLEDEDVDVRTQVAKTIGDGFASNLAQHLAAGPSEEGKIADRTLLSRKLIPLLSDESQRVQFHAAIALGHLGDPAATEPLFAVLDRLGNVDFPYLRHAVAMGLAGCATTEDLAAHYHDDFELEHAAAVIALRRRADPAVADYLTALTANVAEDAARAIHDDWTIPEAMPKLAEALGESLVRSEPYSRRAINANYRFGKLEHANRVAEFAANSEALPVLRLDAIDALMQWADPPPLDRVVGRAWSLGKRDPKVAPAAAATVIDRLMVDPESEIQEAAMRLADALDLEISAEALLTLFQRTDSPQNLRLEALRTLDGLGEAPFEKAAIDSDALIRAEAHGIFAKRAPERAVDHLPNVIASSNSTTFEKQRAVEALASIGKDTSDVILTKLVADFQNVPAGIRIELAEAAQTRKLAGAPAEIPFDWCLEGGDAKRGEEVFRNHLAAQCIRCHKVSDDKGGSTVGPNLKSIGREKDRAYLLESLVNPQAVIAEGYGTISLTLKDGMTVAGIIQKEKDGVLELLDPEGKKLRVKASDIAERSAVVSTMPPVGLILTRREVRDVMEYLSSLKAKAKK